jgi:hypothetical protein
VVEGNSHKDSPLFSLKDLLGKVQGFAEHGFDPEAREADLAFMNKHLNCVITTLRETGEDPTLLPKGWPGLMIILKTEIDTFLHAVRTRDFWVYKALP